jgi:hypothetical protein
MVLTLKAKKLSSHWFGFPVTNTHNDVNLRRKKLLNPSDLNMFQELAAK